MQDLVTINENHQPVTTSVKIAEVFGKEHRNVIRAINNIIGDLRNLEDSGRLNFEQSSYINLQGKEQKQYIVTRDGFTLLAMGFTGKKALEFKIQYIAAFNAMEQALRSQVPAPLDAKAVGGIVKNCCAVAVREELEKAATDMIYADKFKQLAKSAAGDVIYSEKYFGALKKLIIPWVKEAFKGGDAAVWNDFIAMGLETRANALLEAKKEELAKEINRILAA